MSKQILVIHGGEAFDTYEEYVAALKTWEVSLDNKKGWKSSLQETLGDEYTVIQPRMPNATNAKYAEWKIWFEKYIPLLEESVIFIGHSLGGIFLAKYLSEEIYPKKITATFLVAAPYNTETNHPLADFNITQPLTKFEEQGGEIYLYHSNDDQVVPFSNFERYRNELPNTHVRIFDDRGHFNGEEFVELRNDLMNQKEN